MQTVLFNETIFGPIHSRRLGTSLGVNLSPRDGKVCSFDCLYCEAGFNAQGTGTTGLPARQEVKELLEKKLYDMREGGEKLDVITFSGNGEPTLHPDFYGIIQDTVELRDRYYPSVKISVLSNSTRLENESVRKALLMVDNNILKLDSAIETTMRMIDRPVPDSFTVDKVVGELAGFGDKCIIQTMLLRGEHDGMAIDNTTADEIEALVRAYLHIRPKEVMLYSIDRKTPKEHLSKVSRDEIESVAERIRRHGIKVSVS